MAPTKNLARTVNLDDVDLGAEGEVLGEGSFDQAVDFNAIKGTQVVPTGEYHLRAANVKLGLAKTSGKPKITIKLEILSGEFEGVPVFQDFAWAETAQARSKRHFIGMGLPDGYQGTLRQMAEALQGLEFYGIFDIEQSDGINERTQMPYEPRNRLVSTSPEPQTNG